MKTYCKSLVVAAVTSLFTLPGWAAGYDEKPGAKDGGYTVTGTIEKIDSVGHSLTIKGAVKSKTFKMANDATITTTAKTDAALSDLKVGDKIIVTYEERNGVMTAH